MFCMHTEQRAQDLDQLLSHATSQSLHTPKEVLFHFGQLVQRILLSHPSTEITKGAVPALTWCWESNSGPQAFMATSSQFPCWFWSLYAMPSTSNTKLRNLWQQRSKCCCFRYGCVLYAMDCKLGDRSIMYFGVDQQRTGHSYNFLHVTSTVATPPRSKRKRF